MSRRDAWRVLLTAVGLALASASAQGTVTIIGTFPVQQLLLAVGSTGSVIDTVSMTVPGADVGDAAKPVFGSPVIRVIAFARAPAGTPNFELVVDSATPLSNGSGGIIPMSEIAWTSNDGSISSGVFAASPNQLLLSAPANRAVVDHLRFRYLNTTVPSEGTYQGRVRFTLSVP